MTGDHCGRGLSMRRHGALLLALSLGLGCSSSSSNDEDTVGGFHAASYADSSGTALPYRFFAPEGADSDATPNKYPLILFLHGEDGRGTDNTAQLTETEGATAWTEPDRLATNPAYVLAPQLAPGKAWTDDAVHAATMGLLDEFLASHPNVDRKRLYLVGFAMGGTGVWDYLLRNPAPWAAAMPISGDADAWLDDAAAWAALVNKPIMPIWTADDPISSPAASAAAVAALTSAGDISVSTVAQTWAAGGVNPPHHAWWPAFHKYGVVYNWLFQQSKARTGAPSALYTVKDLGDGVKQVWDYGLNTSFVVERQDKALVVDTMGITGGDYYGYLTRSVLSSPSVPIEVAITHNHGDHLQGLPSFRGRERLKKVYVNQADDTAKLESYLGSDSADLAKITHITEGDTIPLGGGTVRNILVPGHTAGSTVFWYENNLFAGDAVGSGDLWMFSDITENYVQGVQHLLDVVGSATPAFLGGHTGEYRYGKDVGYVRNVLGAAKGILDGSIPESYYFRGAWRSSYYCYDANGTPGQETGCIVVMHF